MVMNARSVDGNGHTFERDMLRDTARTFLAKHSSLEWVAEQADQDAALSPPEGLWPAISEMGWTSVTIPEDKGGAGLALGDQAVLFEEFGRALYPGPYFSSVALTQPCIEGSPQALDRMVAGTSAFTAAWAEPDGPSSLADIGQAKCRAESSNGEWQLFGVKTAVPDLEAVDEIVVAAREHSGVGFFLVEVACDGVDVQSGVAIDPTRRDGCLVLEGAPAARLVPPELMPMLVMRMRARGLVAATFEALGVGDRILGESVEYARTREQFGKPIGAFQAVSGPLAECYVDLQLARSLAEWALRAMENDEPSAEVAVVAAKAASSEAAVRVVETAIQVFGAIGFTWEHHLHRYLKRSLWLYRFEGPGGHHRAVIANALLDRAAAPEVVELMDDRHSAEFRAQVRAWIDESLPTERRGIGLITSRTEFDRVRAHWQRAMAETGHLVAHWPKAFGGRDAPPLLTAIFREEAIRAHPRVSHGDGGLDLVAPLLIEHGTEEQQQRYLGGIRAENEIWAQGFSEPDAGSDLAALKTRAVPDGNHWILNGTKTWTTYAPWADWLFVLARSDPATDRHRGITCFIVDAKAPGVEIRPITDIAGDVEFGEVFLTDVRVPAENVLGEVNDGWTVAITTLANERVIESCEDIGELDFTFDRLLDCVRELPAEDGVPAKDPIVRDSIAALWSQLQAVRLTQYRSLVALSGSDVPPPESAIIKLAWSEVAQRVARLGMELFGLPRDPSVRSAHVGRYWQDAYLTSRSFTIYAGTSEILRSVIAEHVLGLPRSR
jgi:3-oxochol-4-en-24-oyl-CoA dehydrogenase